MPRPDGGAALATCAIEFGRIALAAALRPDGAAPRRMLLPDAGPAARLARGRTSAQASLETGLAHLAGEVAARRLVLYRDYVGATVTGVSPLLVRLCGLREFRLDDLVYRLAPDLPWIVWLCGPLPLRSPRRGSGLSQDGRRASGIPSRELHRFAHGGVVVAEAGDGDAFGLRVLDRGLELGARLGRSRLRTSGGGGALDVPGRMSETVAASLPGRPLDALVRHPLLDGAGCVVERVDEPTRWGRRIHFGLAPMRWTMPWARSGGTGEGVGQVGT